jgi:hypothetical protein
LVADQSLIDHRQVLQIRYVIILHHKYSAADLYYIVDPQGMQTALLTLSREAEPGAVRRSHILKVKTFLTLSCLVGLGLEIGDFGVEITHLRVILDTEGILHVSSNAEA